MKPTGEKQPFESADPPAATKTVLDSEVAPGVAPSQLKAPLSGAMFGRYLLLEELGAGSSGVVHSAFDFALERKIALKLLRETQSTSVDAEGAFARLAEEAKAMARLSHPNVVTVHEVGSANGRPFVAMERVKGPTLRVWLRDAHPWREVLEVFLAAGEGLSAAHRAGVLHRDFKPENVIVGDDGRVRVTDFGLASAYVSSADSGPRSSVGTPAYMAPEQHRGFELDARADAYAFCVALFEGLYGVRPFGGRSPEELEQQKLQETLASLPIGAAGPRRLLGILRRALRAAPALRFSSMDALLREVERLRDRPRRRAIAVGVVLTAALVAGATIQQINVRRMRCPNPQAQLASFWNSGSQEAMRGGFLRTGLPYAKDVFDTARHTLDAYLQRWVGFQQQVCKSLTPSEASTTSQDLRLSCLDHRLEEARALIAQISHPDAKLVERAVGTVRRLSPLEECTRVVTFTPPDPKKHAELEREQLKLADARALQATVHFKESGALAAEVVVSAERLGDQPLAAEAHFIVAETQRRLSQFKRAEEEFYLALAAAEAGHHDLMRAKIWRQLGVLEGYDLRQVEHGLRDAHIALGAFEAMGAPPADQESLHEMLGAILMVAGKYQESLNEDRQAIALQDRVGAPLPKLFNNLAVSLGKLGHHEEALASYRRALTLIERTQGPSHPEVATYLDNMGNEQGELGRPKAAAALLLRALALNTELFGPDNPVLAHGLDNLAFVAAESGDFAQAVGYSQRAIHIIEKAAGPSSPDLVFALTMLGVALTGQHEFSAAFAAFDRAADLGQRVFGPESSLLISVVNQKAFALSAHGEYQAALPLHEQAVRASSQQPENEPLELAEDLMGVGRAYLGLGRPSEAIAPLERALAMAPLLNVCAKAKLQFSLGQSLFKTHNDPKRGLELVHRARDLCAASGTTTYCELPAIQAWLAEVGPAHSL